MSDQCEIQLPKTRVPEETAFDLTAAFRTRATRAALAPTTVEYRVDCLSTKQQLTDWTTVSPAASVTISIPSATNQIKNGDHKWERKQITIRADSGLSTQIIKPSTWIVDNLYGIT